MRRGNSARCGTAEAGENLKEEIMAAFANMIAADERARALMESGAATVAHSCRLPDGTIAVRLLRPMSATGTTQDGMNQAGAWDVVTDDSET
jgi:hypothetical protein